MGSGGSSTQYRKRDPEPQGLVDVRTGLYNAVMPGLQSFSPEDWNKAKNTANNALDMQSQLMSKLPGAINTSSGIADEIAQIARTGNIPTALTNNINKSVNQGLQSSMGSMLNNLGSRGVINSSITGQGINNLAQNAADAYNRNYLSAYQATISGLGTALQGQNTSLDNIATNIYALGKIPEQAYEGAGAGLTPAFNLWKAWQSSYDNREDYDTVVQQGK